MRLTDGLTARQHPTGTCPQRGGRQKDPPPRAASPAAPAAAPAGAPAPARARPPGPTPSRPACRRCRPPRRPAPRTPLRNPDSTPRTLKRKPYPAERSTLETPAAYRQRASQWTAFSLRHPGRMQGIIGDAGRLPCRWCWRRGCGPPSRRRSRQARRSRMRRARALAVTAAPALCAARGSLLWLRCQHAAPLPCRAPAMRACCTGVRWLRYSCCLI